MKVLRMLIFLLPLYLGINEALRSEEISTSTESNILAAQRFMEQKQFSRALSILASVENTSPNPAPEVFMLEASCHLNLNQTDAALDVCQRGMELYPRQATLEDFYVTVLKKYVPVRQMAEKLTLAHDQYPNSPLLLRALVMAQMDLDYANPRLETLLLQLIELEPNDPSNHYLRGMWAFRLKKHELAITEWEKTLSVGKAADRMRLDVNTLIANSEIRLDHPNRAEAAYEKAWQSNLRLREHNPEAALFYAQFLSGNARLEESQKIIRQILSWAPQYGPAHLERALYLQKQHSLEEAIAEANLALKGTGNSREQLRAIHVLLAKANFALKRQAEAQIHQTWLESH